MLSSRRLASPGGTVSSRPGQSLQLPLVHGVVGRFNSSCDGVSRTCHRSTLDSGFRSALHGEGMAPGRRHTLQRARPPDEPTCTPSQEQVDTFNTALYAKVFPFLIPVSVVVLSEPLMALCTSMFVGKYGATVELAALGPSSIIVSFLQYVFYSLQVATLALIATALRDNEIDQAQRVLSCAIFVALAWGIGASLVMYYFPEQLVLLTGVKDPSIIPHAVEYLKIRSFGQPAVLILMVTQAALLAQQKPLIPGIVITTSTLIAIAGHFVTVGLWGWGLQGAAYSTTTANILAALTILVASELKGQLKPRIIIPTKEDISAFVDTVAPLSVTYLSKNACYMLIQTTAAATLTVVQLAAHQAVFSVWTFASFLISPVEQAALTFVPAAQQRWQMLETGKLVMKLGPVIGMIGGLCVFFAIKLSPQWFTKDPLLWPLMTTVAWQTLVALLFTGIDVSSNGMTIALGDGGYVARSLLLTLAIIFAFTSACRYYQWGLEGIWVGIVCFFFVRACRSGYRIIIEFMAGPDPNNESGGQLCPAD